VQFDLLARRVVDLLGYTLIFNRELELVRLNSRRGVLGVIAGLNHLAFVGLEDKALTLEIVDISLVNAIAIHIPELDIQENTKSDQQDY
jgi:hypothetical protein